MFFLIPLLLGFASNLLSAFTTSFSRRWGERKGTTITMILRAIFGIPFWITGLSLAVVSAASPVYLPSIWTLVGGICCLVAGCLIIYKAFVTMRTTALLPSTQDGLVQSGPYAYLRHPMDAGLMLSFMGLVLIKPTPPVIIACALGIAWAAIQTWAEEYDLLQRMPSYKTYKAQVPRLLPRLQIK